jgi:hypothetical protein
MDFNEIARELIEKINTDRFNVYNEAHMNVAKEILSRYIDNDDLLFHVMLSLKFPDNSEKKS